MSDLISRKETICYLRDNLPLKTFMHRGIKQADIACWDVCNMIADRVPSAESEEKWIPVSERLPEDNRQVLVYAQSVHYALAKYDEMMEPDGKRKKQWVTFDAWKPYYAIENVIAWMPLPEPWRGEYEN